jgi:hypothetical protein
MVIEAVKLAMVAIVTRSLGGLACRSRTLPFPPGYLARRAIASTAASGWKQKAGCGKLRALNAPKSLFIKSRVSA